MTAKPWVSVEAVAVRRGVAKDLVCGWIESRYFPAHNIGRFELFDVDERGRAEGAADDTKGSP
jgi:hypothetical protein